MFWPWSFKNHNIFDPWLWTRVPFPLRISSQYGHRPRELQHFGFQFDPRFFSWVLTPKFDFLFRGYFSIRVAFHSKISNVNFPRVLYWVFFLYVYDFVFTPKLKLISIQFRISSPPSNCPPICCELLCDGFRIFITVMEEYNMKNFHCSCICRTDRKNSSEILPEGTTFGPHWWWNRCCCDGFELQVNVILVIYDNFGKICSRYSISHGFSRWKCPRCPFIHCCDIMRHLYKFFSLI